MSAPVPPRFSFFSVPLSKILLVFLTGVAPAVLILLSPLPLWLRVWLWAPMLGLSLVLAFGRLENRPIVDWLLAALRFSRRKRRRVWNNRQETQQEAKEIVARVPSGAPLKGLLTGAAAYGVVIGIALSVTFVLVAGFRWAVQTFVAPDTIHSTHAQYATTTHIASALPTPTPTPVPTPTSTAAPTLAAPPTSVPTPSPVPTLVVHTYAPQASPGSLVLDNATSRDCRVQMSASGSECEIIIPGAETAKILIIPLLHPRVAGNPLSIEAACELDVELIAYRPWEPQRSRFWLVPVCDPPGRVQVRSHDEVAVMTTLSLRGQSLGSPVNVLPTGTWAPEPSGMSCWIYRIESVSPVWLEVLVWNRARWSQRWIRSW